MSDFGKYQSWISELAPLVGSAKFDSKFKQLTVNMARSEAFQLKMEIKRQAKPCFKAVDLRGKVDGQCEPFEHDGRTHYLDSVAANLMTELLEKFDGKYVETIFDALHNTPNNFRVLRQREEQQRKQDALQKLTGHAPQSSSASSHSDAVSHTTTVIPSKYIAKFDTFLNYKPRRDERMLYVTKLSIFTGDNQISGMSVNISSHGMLIKLASAVKTMTAGSEVHIEFVQVNKEVKFKHQKAIAYQVVYHNPGHKDHAYGLRLLSGDAEKEFQGFVEKLILGNKYRYKIDTSNVEEAILQRAFEYQTVATTNLLPIYFHYSGEQLELLYTLQNAKTRDMVDFLNIDRNSGIETIFTAKRLESMLKCSTKQSECLLLVFKSENNGQVKWFAAFNHELPGDLAGLFYYYARKQAQFKQYLVQCRTIDGKSHNIPSILHSSISKEIKRRNMPISPRNEKKLNDINGILTLIDVSDAHWQRWPKVSGDFNLLKQFQVTSAGQKHLQVIPREFIDKRIDTRYPVKSSVVVTVDDVDYEAQSRDISLNGMQIACKKPVKVHKDQVIQANLKQLQGITKIFKLSRLEYKVVGISHNNTRMHMIVVPNPSGQHVGKLFFKELIKANKDKLKPDDVGELQEISAGLTNLLIRNQLQAVTFFNHHNKRFEPVAALSSNQQHLLLKHSPIKKDPEIGQYLEIYKLLTPAVLPLVQNKLKAKLDKPYIDLVIVDKGEAKPIIKADEQFDDDNAMMALVLQAKKAGYPVHILRAVISPIMRFNPDVFRLELKYVKHYTPHRADHVVEQLGHIKGIAHLFEVTDLHIMRWNL